MTAAEELPAVLHLRCLGVPEAARQRLEATGARVVEDAHTAVDALVISTRLGTDELQRLPNVLADHDGRTVVLAHTGADRLAAELVRAGADAVVGEGNEEALIGLADTERTPTALLASFERRFGSGHNSNHLGIDPATRLPDRGAFERRVGELTDADDIPRIAYLKVLSDRWVTAAPDDVVAVQRRRVAIAFANVVHAAGAELYATDDAEFGVVGVDLSPQEADRLGNRLIATSATFRDHGMPLRLVMGHAGSESSAQVELLLDLARRAVEVAAADGVRQVLGGEDLALGVSVTTELEAVVRLLDELEPALPEGRGHGERVGRVAAQLARLRGSSPAAVSRVHLGAHLHDIGRAGLPPGAVTGSDDLSGELLDAWRSFPERSAELLELTAGPSVAAAVRAQRERWDGEGFPDGIGGVEIPEAARILAVAHAIDQLMTSGHVTTANSLASQLRPRSGSELDPELVETAIEHLPELVPVREA